MIEIIKKVVQQGIEGSSLTSLMEGEVVSSSPLKVKIKKNSKLIIPSELLVVPENLKDRTIKVSLSSPYVSTSSENFNNFNANNASMTINNSLKTGDKVMLISFEGGQKYYILDRI
ncbi:DUF2577 domain-containing protein [uncultured Clostridium sp.]|jgi:hypothetical protein|uniref:DUF2577 domain-containing protein n=1 Tax=uncultured Clostridium sp. TaxID=59620 RepID=UPI00260E2D8D|nr:DUF2577 domain-containing protein [uncultured Clostridium sp.]